MKVEKISISKNKFDINLKFYYILKYLVKINFSDKQVNDILKKYYLNIENSIDNLKELFLSLLIKNTKKVNKQKEFLIAIFDEISTNIDLKLFVFGLKLFLIKDLLLQEAKLKQVLNIAKLKSFSI